MLLLGAIPCIDSNQILVKREASTLARTRQTTRIQREMRMDQAARPQPGKVCPPLSSCISFQLLYTFSYQKISKKQKSSCQIVQPGRPKTSNSCWPQQPNQKPTRLSCLNSVVYRQNNQKDASRVTQATIRDKIRSPQKINKLLTKHKAKLIVLEPVSRVVQITATLVRQLQLYQLMQCSCLQEK
jgi:hypothetical protein